MDDKEMILSPSRWPCWPLLPLKRRTRDANDPECGFICATNQASKRVFLGNIFTAKGDMKSTKFLDYSDVDALLADGWQVD